MELKYKLDKRQIFCLIALLFIIGGISGWIYEMLFYRINDGEFVRRGQGIGPWLPIYGFGSIFISAFASKFKESKLKVFAVSGVVSGILEYITGWVLFTFFDGLRLWNYNTEIWNWGNINGYICIRSVMLFAFAGLFLIYFLIPVLKKTLAKTSKNASFTVCLILSVIVASDIFCGYILKVW